MPCTFVGMHICTNRHHSRLACLLGAPEKTPRRGFLNAFVSGISEVSMSASGIDARAASSAFCLGVRPAFRIIFMTCLRRCQLGRGTGLAASRLPSGPARSHRAWAWCTCRWRAFEACLASCPAFRSSYVLWSRLGGFLDNCSTLKPSDAPTGGRRAFIPETSGVIMPAPRIAALYGDSTRKDFSASPRKRRFCPVRLNSAGLGHSRASREICGCRTAAGRPEYSPAACPGASSRFVLGATDNRRDLV